MTETPEDVAKEVINLNPQAPCLSCHRGMGITVDRLVGYLKNEPVACPHCAVEVDWFETLKQSSSFISIGFGAVGAMLSVIEVRLVPNGTVWVDLEKSIGANKRLLWIQYTGRGDGKGVVWPIEVHGNDPFRAPRAKFSLFGQVRGEVPAEPICQIGVTWVEHSPDDSSWTSLVDAFECFHDKDYTAMLVPANVAVESRMGRMLGDLLMKRVSLGKERVERFLQDGATYGHQIDVLLPLIVAMTGAPPLRDRVAAGLKQLRTLRNAIAHRGEPGRKVDQDLAGELLVAALLGVVYVEMLREILLPVVTPRDPDAAAPDPGATAS